MSGKKLRLTVRRGARLLERGLITSEQLAGFCHSMAVAGEEIWGLNAYTNVMDRDKLLDHAHQSDIRRTDGRTLSILDGIPISIKSNIAVKDFPLTAGSRILGMGRKDGHPCGYDADTVKILTQNCGSILVGLTSMDEFGMGSLGNNIPACIDNDDDDGQMLSSAVTKNPLPYIIHLNLFSSNANSKEAFDDEEEMDAKLAETVSLPHDKILELHLDAFNVGNDDGEIIYSAGGSSCGSAASVAHGSAMLSLGTDTGGSVRLPASWCSIVGLKPSYGLLSRHGIVSYASSFDTVGIIGSSVDCVSLALEKLAQRQGEESHRDSTFSSYPSPSRNEQKDSLYTTMTKSTHNGDSPLLHGIRIGIPSAFSVKECPPEIRQAWSEAAESLSIRGAEIIEILEDDVRPTVVQNALSAYYVLVSAEASSNLSRYDGFRYAVPEPSVDRHTGTSSSPADGEMMVDPNLTPLERQYATTRSQGFGKEVSRRVLCGTSVLSSDRFHTYYEAAGKLRALLGRQLRQVLDEKVDMLLVPTALTLPCRLDKNTAEIDSTETFANDVMTVGPSLAGLPAVSIPVRIHGESTFTGGLQLIGPRLREDVILDVGRVLEEANSCQ